MARKVRKYYNDSELGSIGQSDHGDFTVISIESYKECRVRFNETGFVRSSNKHAINTGALRDAYFKAVYGQGYLGEGPYKTTTRSLADGDINTFTNRADSCWRNLLGRCYDTEREDYPRYGAVGCAVKEEWKSFQNFCEFYSNNWVEGLQLDKDILVPGNKIYGPETCCFVPSYINNLIIHPNEVKANGLPLGVFIKRPTPGMVSELKRPYGAALNSKNIGYYETKEEAHRMYQLAKAEHMLTVLVRYKAEPTFNGRVFDALESRVNKLKMDASQGIETTNI